MEGLEEFYRELEKLRLQFPEPRLQPSEADQGVSSFGITSRKVERGLLPLGRAQAVGDGELSRFALRIEEGTAYAGRLDQGRSSFCKDLEKAVRR